MQTELYSYGPRSPGCTHLHTFILHRVMIPKLLEHIINNFSTIDKTVSFSFRKQLQDL